MPTDLDTLLSELSTEVAGDDENTDPEKIESETLKTVRDWGKQQEKDKKELAKALIEAKAQLDTLNSERRQVEVSTVFRELGLSEKQATLFNGDEVTPDAVKEWALQYDLIKPGDGEEAPVKNEGFKPAAGFEVGDGSKKLTKEQFTELSKTNESAAIQAVKEGRYTPVMKL